MFITNVFKFLTLFFKFFQTANFNNRLTRPEIFMFIVMNANETHRHNSTRDEKGALYTCPYCKTTKHLSMWWWAIKQRGGRLRGNQHLTARSSLYIAGNTVCNVHRLCHILCVRDISPWMCRLHKNTLYCALFEKRVYSEFTRQNWDKKLTSTIRM